MKKLALITLLNVILHASFSQDVNNSRGPREYDTITLKEIIKNDCDKTQDSITILPNTVIKGNTIVVDKKHVLVEELTIEQIKSDGNIHTFHRIAFKPQNR